ncbi:MAG: VCBS repeat-containing protein [Planctomycetaceae bacterium]|nr:VCBS repeat-containing protein [Planctomycetaceae bacterium]MCB9953622.1 VCBS repeat-containing protein [Planctomycetaceae bacterium]
MLTAYVVNTLLDNPGVEDGLICLREAIEASNTNMPSGDAPAGTFDDSITFDPSLFAGGPQTLIVGGVFLNIQGNLTITGPGVDLLTISGNDTTRVFFIGDYEVSISDMTLANGHDGFGGAIRNGGNLTLTRTWITSNTATSDGGGIYNSLGNLVIRDSAITGNTSGSHGGGIDNGSGHIELINTTVSGNNANRFGGGIIFGTSSSGVFINSTITGNRANADGPGTPNGIGGGIYVGDDGGIKPIMHNSIVAGNFVDSGSTSDDIRGGKPFDSTSSNNLIGDAATAGGLQDGQQGNIVGLAGAGVRPIESILETVLTKPTGKTPFHSLVSTSPAIDHGNNSHSADGQSDRLLFDQRGAPFVRVMNEIVDIGAVEFERLNVNTFVDEIDMPDTLSLREAIIYADNSPDASTITFKEAELSQTITLMHGRLALTTDMTIVGPGPSKLAISGNDEFQIFDIDFATVEISGLSLTKGRATSSNNNGENASNGAAISIGSAPTTLRNLWIHDNISLGGGAIFGWGPVVLDSCTLSNNHAIVDGGGIASKGEFLIINSTISNNTANERGGGIMHHDGVITIINSTITGNRSDADGNGSVIHFGGGIYPSNVGSNAAIVHNSIIAGNFNGTGNVPDDVRGAPLSSSSTFNIIGYAGTRGGLTDGANGNIVGVNGIGLRDINTILDTLLQDNGGETPTHGLVPGSPALDSGSPVFATVDGQQGSQPLGVDQRNQSRVLGTIDIGAVEGLADDFANSASTASLIPEGTVVGGFQYLGDTDFFQFNVEAGVTYDFTVSVEEGSRLFLTLFDVDGTTELAQGLELTPTSTGLSMTFDADGLYYLQISEIETGGRPDYQLKWNGRRDDLILFDEGASRWRMGISDGTMFTWLDGPKWNPLVAWKTFSGDFDGDGLTDGIGITSGNQVFVARNNGNGTMSTVSAGSFSSQETFQHMLVGDLNGDGRDDLIAQQGTNNTTPLPGSWFVKSFNGSEFVTSFYGRWEASGWVDFGVGDVNQDGVDDIIGLRNANEGVDRVNWLYGISNVIPDSTRRLLAQFAGAFEGRIETVGWHSVLIGDWDNDGRSDVAARRNDGRFVFGTATGGPTPNVAIGANRLINSTGPLFSNTAFSGPFLVGDFNGDGRDDIFARQGNDRNLWVAQSSETAPTSSTAQLWGAWDDSMNWAGAIVGDFNGDGRDDYVSIDLTESHFWISLSTGLGFTPMSDFGVITGAEPLVGPYFMRKGILN